MKEQVTDISKVLQGMTEEMRLLRATVNQQYAEIIKLNRNINALNLEIRKKDTELINLQERLAKYENPDKNSNNSSTPPSKERIKDEVIRRTRSLRKPSGKKPGGQKGHDGHKLPCSSIPDEIIDEVPNYCTRCGESLSDTERVLDYVTQVISIPELKPVIREIRHYVMVCKNQVCLAHLLRELQYLSELNTEQEWSGKVTNLFREAIHERNTNPNDVIDKVSWIERLDNLIKQNIEELGKKFITFRKGLVKCRDYIFNFLENPMIPFDNNGSERGIRKLKIKLKNSCAFRSDFGADAFLELHSIVETAKKHDKTPYNAIQALFKV
ncbi:transposase [Prevotella melaninogenica]|uniref:IS66 family transposase n=1 Tax=Prevotella melaninogenica TaxID=28132 RepID=UPI001BAD129D|nr:transposase [Prevotella melaninogenica]QUB63408.1 transposase [Prevotella melaninogenica]QUB64396.1 transposase [Prevotella melaninogenica]